MFNCRQIVDSQLYVYLSSSPTLQIWQIDKVERQLLLWCCQLLTSPASLYLSLTNWYSWQSTHKLCTLVNVQNIWQIDEVHCQVLIKYGQSCKLNQSCTGLTASYGRHCVQPYVQEPLVPLFLSTLEQKQGIMKPKHHIWAWKVLKARCWKCSW